MDTIIKRTNDNSFFIRAHANSKVCKELFEEDAKYANKSVSIIQMLMIEEGYLLIEIINKSN